jgi:hypothetical protein
LWKYQHTDARFSQHLKEKIDGYNQGRLYNVEHARKEREAWL